MVQYTTVCIKSVLYGIGDKDEKGQMKRMNVDKERLDEGGWVEGLRPSQMSSPISVRQRSKANGTVDLTVKYIYI